MHVGFTDAQLMLPPLLYMLVAILPVAVGGAVRPNHLVRVLGLVWLFTLLNDPSSRIMDALSWPFWDSGRALMPIAGKPQTKALPLGHYLLPTASALAALLFYS